MDRLDKDQRVMLKWFQSQDGEEGVLHRIDERYGERKWYARDTMDDLQRMGFLYIHRSDQGWKVALTSKGVTYFHERRMDFFERYLALVIGCLLSGLLGILGTLLGVWYGSQIG